MPSAAFSTSDPESDLLRAMANIQDREEAQISDYSVTRILSTRWSDIDIYGHVNNAVYTQLFDTAINGWIIEETGFNPAAAPVIGVVVQIQLHLPPRDQLSPDSGRRQRMIEHRHTVRDHLRAHDRPARPDWTT